MNQREEFERMSKERPPGLFRELLEFLVSNKKWWLVPLILGFAVIGLFAIFTASPVFPFIYTLF